MAYLWNHITQPGPPREPVVIVTPADDNYAMPVAVSLWSALRHLDRARNVSVYILEDNITGANKDRIQRVLHAAHPLLRLEWIRPDLTSLQNVTLNPRYTRATLMRLLAPLAVPDHVECILVVDSDLVVERDLSEVWDLGPGEEVLFAAQDFIHPTLRTGLRRSIGYLELEPDLPHFNAGVMLINVRRWRVERVTERALHFLNTFGERAPYMEQDALNAVLAGSWRELPSHWNIQLMSIENYQESTTGSGDRRQLPYELLGSPGILHYTGVRKPWHWRYRGPAGEAFFQHLLASGWFGPIKGGTYVASRRMSHALYRMLSRVKRRFAAVDTDLSIKRS